MSKIDIVETTKTPRILGDSEKGTLSISGKSLPENARLFYEPLMEWFEDLKKVQPEEIKVDLDIEYYNTSTSSIIFKMLDMLKKLSSKSKMVISWRFEEDDLEMEEVGQDFQKVLGDIFILSPKKSINDSRN